MSCRHGNWSPCDECDEIDQITAAKDAEIEALRAGIRELQADRDSWEQQASDRVADWYIEHRRADRLAEALQDLRDRVLPAALRYHGVGHGYVEEAKEIAVRALLREQEEGK